MLFSVHQSAGERELVPLNAREETLVPISVRVSCHAIIICWLIEFGIEKPLMAFTFIPRAGQYQLNRVAENVTICEPAFVAFKGACFPGCFNAINLGCSSAAHVYVT